LGLSGCQRNHHCFCNYGPAVAWEDEFRLYYLNGSLTSEVFFTAACDLDARLILKERNAEARKEIIEKLGIKNVIKSLGGTILDRIGDYELIVTQWISDIEQAYIEGNFVYSINRYSCRCVK